MVDNYKNIVDSLFMKKFCLKSKKLNLNSSTNLPDPELIFSSINRLLLLEENDQSNRRDINWNNNNYEKEEKGDYERTNKNFFLENFQNLKSLLNGTKNRLSDKDMEQWHDHTRNTNPAGSIVLEIKRRLKPELCTQAWLKFYEILSTFPNLVRSRGRFRTLHLCEAPGAFICALNYYLQTKKLWIQEWQWRANSLNPYYEGNSYECMIGDDRFIFHTNQRWIFGKDDTGDLTSTNMLEWFLANGGEYDLVTADGSIDCQEDPNEQERQVLLLHYCETVVALHRLCKGGNYVLKRFTMFEPASIAILYLLCRCFEEVNLFKPASSKSGNSEMYVICESFNGLPSTYLSKLRSYYGQSSSANTLDQPSSINLLNEIPFTFLQTTYTAQKFFIDHQLAMVQFNLATFRLWTPDLQSQANQARLYVVDRFLTLTNLSSTKSENEEEINFKKLVKGFDPLWLKNMPYQTRYGTNNQKNPDQDGERPRYTLQNLCDELDLYRERLSTIDGGASDIRSLTINDYSCPLASAEWYKNGERQLEPVYGRRLTELVSSKLCNACLLILYRNLRHAYESRNIDELNKDAYEVEALELCQFRKYEDKIQTSSNGFDGTNEQTLRIDLTSNRMSKLDWLNFLLTLVSSDKPPQTVEITRSRLLMLTRFSGNILVVICACYERVSLNVCNDTCTIKAENYRRLPTTYAQNFVSFLHRIKYGLTKRERNGGTNSSDDLLQFLPMQYLAEPTFLKKIHHFNNTMLLKIGQDILAAVTKKKQ